ncbi:2Fe-2S iron-sulfur cluster-binding protein [Streptomyces sp. NPDC058877]|uniref:2Fe-2S iron-sulfur cluster-binding protein n=1 Tax=unclassified Streptomyces TaxID=2593676 RepID=UPI0036AC5147
MDLTVNGTARQVQSPPEGGAIRLLRETLGLTGTKLVCGAGVCGACTVLVDGVPRVACLTPAAALEGKDVTTVEGLEGNHPVQRAFAAHDALQCGYCTPGFVVEASGFVDRWRAEHGDAPPSRNEIAAALAGHLCRCGAYEKIYAAVTAACTGAHDEEDTPPPRVEAMQKITGRALYTTDLHPNGLLEGVLLRSRHAHARVRSLTGGNRVVDLLPEDRTVRYVGQPIAAVAAETLGAARAAAEQVLVDYEDLPAVVDLRRAGVPESPVVHVTRKDREQAPNSSEGSVTRAKWNGNVRGPAQLNWRGGRAVKRILQARAVGDRRLVEATFTTEPQVHTPLEPHACLASWDGDGDLHLWVSTQAVGAVAEQAAERFGLTPDRVHASAVHVGGGFGSKRGNLLQHNRCWHYRNPHFRCHRDGGDECPAHSGVTLHGTVVPQGPCIAPHPSSIAIALLGYDAAVEVHGLGTVGVADLYGDGSDPTRDHLLAPHQILTAVTLPAPLSGERAAYDRAISRAEAEWPLVETVARAAMSDGLVRAVAVAAGGIAHTPLRLPEVEGVLLGRRPTPELLLTAATERCAQREGTRFKVDLLRDTVLDVLKGAIPAEA